jgi:hypothetical protein
MLPGSIFATAGARAMGDAGRMPHGHKEVAGLQIAYVARDALTAHLRCPVFGRITTLNRKKGGGKAERGAALGCGPWMSVTALSWPHHTAHDVAAASSGKRRGAALERIGLTP